MINQSIGTTGIKVIDQSLGYQSSSVGYIPALNEAIMRQVEGMEEYRVSDYAPNTEMDLFGHDGELVVWSGASDKTIYGNPSVNWAFRAWHDSVHLDHGIGLTIPGEIAVARIQASLLGGRLGDVLYAEVGGQAEYYMKNGHFPVDQKGFIQDYLSELWRESVLI